MEFISRSLDDTKEIASQFAQTLHNGDVVLFYGDLGAGKTTFIKSLCFALGVRDEVTSPTFTILNEYTGKLPIHHFDMYRLKDANEAIESGLDEILRYGDGVCLVEWPEKVVGILPENAKIIKITILDDNSRKLEILEAK